MPYTARIHSVLLHALGTSSLSQLFSGPEDGCGVPGSSARSDNGQRKKREPPLPHVSSEKPGHPCYEPCSWLPQIPLTQTGHRLLPKPIALKGKWGPSYRPTKGAECRCLKETGALVNCDNERSSCPKNQHGTPGRLS